MLPLTHRMLGIPAQPGAGVSGAGPRLQANREHSIPTARALVQGPSFPAIPCLLQPPLSPATSWVRALNTKRLVAAARTDLASTMSHPCLAWACGQPALG